METSYPWKVTLALFICSCDSSGQRQRNVTCPHASTSVCASLKFHEIFHLRSTSQGAKLNYYIIAAHIFAKLLWIHSKNTVIFIPSALLLIESRNAFVNDTNFCFSNRHRCKQWKSNIWRIWFWRTSSIWDWRKVVGGGFLCNIAIESKAQLPSSLYLLEFSVKCGGNLGISNEPKLFNEFLLSESIFINCCCQAVRTYGCNKLVCVCSFEKQSDLFRKLDNRQLQVCKCIKTQTLESRNGEGKKKLCVSFELLFEAKSNVRPVSVSPRLIIKAPSTNRIPYHGASDQPLD